MSYVINELKEEDLPEVTAIYNYYITNSTATFHTNPLSIPDMKEIVWFDNPRYRSFVIKESNIIIGYIILAQHHPRQAYQNTAEVSIYLNHSYTGKGIGSMGLKCIEDYARTQGFHVLVATICGENQNSIHLMEKNGYEKCAHYKEVGKKFGRWLDIVAYQKIIQ